MHALMCDLVQVGAGVRLEADHQAAKNPHGDDCMVPKGQSHRQAETAAADQQLPKQKIHEQHERQRQRCEHLTTMLWNHSQCLQPVSQEHSNDHHSFCQWPRSG
jgi:hypothetical protein